MTTSRVIPTAVTLGSSRIYEFLLERVFASDHRRRLVDVRDFCLASSYGIGASFDAAVELLVAIGFVSRSGSWVQATPRLLEATAEERVGLAICRRLVECLSDASEIDIFFPSGAFSWGREPGYIYLHLSRIPLKALPVAKLMRDLGAATDSEESEHILRFNQSFADLLHRAMAASTWAVGGRKRCFHPEELAELQALQLEQGERAEEYVLQLERSRLKDHPMLALVKRVSLSDVSVGYDIQSFQSALSVFPDKFIEVKSYSRDERFYISEGEILAARTLTDRYFLCLVDMEQLQEFGYTPRFIQNPAAQLFDCSKWQLKPVKFEVLPCSCRPDTVRGSSSTLSF